MQITLQLFGGFRPLGTQLELCLPEDATVSDIPKALTQKIAELDSSFTKQALVKVSRFATETELLNENDLLNDGATIAIIPPVAGG